MMGPHHLMGFTKKRLGEKMTTKGRSNLAINGGPKAVQSETGDLFKWPIVTQEDEEAVLAILRRGAMSGWDVTRQFEEELLQYGFFRLVSLHRKIGIQSLEELLRLELVHRQTPVPN